MRVPLTTGAYQSRSIISDAQRCVNLYPEKNPKDSPYPYTHYPTPGLKALALAPGSQGEFRCLYTASNAHCYACVGSGIYDVSSAYAFTLIGTISSSSGIVSMYDNSLCMVIVDGSSSGWVVDLASNAFAAIVADAFYGSSTVHCLDTYFIFNRPNTTQFYISLSNVSFADMQGGPILTGAISNAGSTYTNGVYSSKTLTGGHGSAATADITVAGNIVTTVTIIDGGEAFQPGDVLSANASDIGGTGTGFAYTVATVGSSSFDPLDIAAKTGDPDKLVIAAVMHREISLLGQKTSEVWYNSGAADFTFAALPGAYIEHGCAAVYSVAQYDLALFFLGQDDGGDSVIYQESNYRVEIVSTRAVSNAINSYAVKSDAIGFCYLQSGHVFYVLTFPTENVTWVYDVTEQHWHERSWRDPETGIAHRWRPNCICAFNGKLLGGDFEDGTLYQIDLDTYQDAGDPIERIRSFPHILEDGDRVIYTNLLAQFEVGNDLSPPDSSDPAICNMRMSDTAGRSYGETITQSFGAPGEYLTSMQWNRLGMGRDRVFELSWTAPLKTALNGVYLTYIKAGS